MLIEAAKPVPRRLQRLWQRAHEHLTMRRWLWWIVACAVATALLVPTFARIEFGTLVHDLRRADARWLAVAVVANFLTLPLMTAQWQLLLPRDRAAPFRQLWPCVAVGMASMNVLPAAAGHAVATGMLASRGVTTVRGGVSMLALEQICEAVAKVLLVAFVAALVPMPVVLWRIGGLVFILGGLISVGAVWISRRATGGGGAKWRAWSAHLESLWSPRRFSLACGLSVLMKVAAWFAIDAVQRSVGISLSPGQTALVLAAVTFASMISIAPGGLGFFELGAVASYRLFGIAAPQAAAVSILIHVAFLLPIVGTGYLMILGRAVLTMRQRP